MVWALPLARAKRTTSSSFSRTVGSSELRLYFPRPSSVSSPLNSFPWETSQAAARPVVSFSPVFLTHPEPNIQPHFPSQSSPTSPSLMNLCCWKTSGRPWRTCCSSSKVRKVHVLTNLSPDAHYLPRSHEHQFLLRPSTDRVDNTLVFRQR